MSGAGGEYGGGGTRRATARPACKGSAVGGEETAASIQGGGSGLSPASHGAISRMSLVCPPGHLARELHWQASSSSMFLSKCTQGMPQEEPFLSSKDSVA